MFCNSLGGGRLRAANSGLPSTNPEMMTRVIATHPPVELVDQRDDHTRVWEVVREVETIHPDGSTTVDTVKSYIHEKGSGLCYKDATGSYAPAVAEWRETPDGYVIDRCAYGLAIGRKVGAGMGYNVEGHELALRPAYLMVSDGVNEAHLALLNPDAEGFIVEGKPSVVRFPAAFGPGYDLEYVAEKGGFHQNLIIAAPPELPAGLDPGSSTIYLYTEMNLDEYLGASGCDVSVEGESFDTSALDLIGPPSRGGCISFCRGGHLLHAFSVSHVTDASWPGAPDRQTLAEKRLTKDSSTGAAYLLESLPFSFFTDDAATYPVIWDYLQKSGLIQQDETWQPPHTYWVTGTVSVSAKLTVLAGTVVKVNPACSIEILSGGAIAAKGEPTNHITFTNAEDNTCGEDLPSPPPGRASYLINLKSGSLPCSVVQHCKLRHAYQAICACATESFAEPIADNVIADTSYGIYVYYSPGVWHCRNNLVEDSYIGIVVYDCGEVNATNNTVDDCTAGIWTYDVPEGKVTDNLLTNCDYGLYCWYDTECMLGYNGFYNPGGTDFCSVEGISPGPGNRFLQNTPYASQGEFFLDQSCPLIDAGSAWAPTPLDGPEAYSTCEHAKRDVGRADIGYHYTQYADSDADTMPDVWEEYWNDHKEDPQQPSFSTQSDDGNSNFEPPTETNDELANKYEFLHGTNPYKYDTDEDGYGDNDEVGEDTKELLRGWGPAVYDFKAGPWLTNVTSSAVTFAWWVPDDAGSPYIYYKKESDSSFTGIGSKYIATRDDGISGKVYERHQSMPSSDTVYQYYVKCTVGDPPTVRTSPVCKFRTLESNPSSFSFIVYGDNRGQDNSNFNEYAAHVVRAILSKAPAARFVMHVGDFVYTGTTAEQWRQHFFLPSTRLIAEYPVFPVRGNHESSVTYYQVFFDYDGDPNDGSYPTWYHFHSGDCHFVVMDSDAPYDDHSTQYGHLSNWLGEAAEYTLFFGHRPPHTDSSAHPYQEGQALRQEIDPLLSANYVEAHFGGHSHLYERWVRGTGPQDIDYFVIGGGGATLHYSISSEDPEDYQAVRQVETPQGEEYYNFSVVSATPGGCTVTLWNIEDLEEPVEEHQVTPYQPQ